MSFLSSRPERPVFSYTPMFGVPAAEWRDPGNQLQYSRFSANLCDLSVIFSARFYFAHTFPNKSRAIIVRCTSLVPS